MFLTLTCPSYGSVSDDGGPAVTPPVDTHEHLARFEVGPVHAAGWVGRCTLGSPALQAGLLARLTVRIGMQGCRRRGVGPFIARQRALNVSAVLALLGLP